jgi:hypothetical protein
MRLVIGLLIVSITAVVAAIVDMLRCRKPIIFLAVGALGMLAAFVLLSIYMGLGG